MLTEAGEAPEPSEHLEPSEPTPDTVAAEEIMLRVARAVRGFSGGASASVTAPAQEETALGLEDWRVSEAESSDEADTEDWDDGVEEDFGDVDAEAEDDAARVDTCANQDTEQLDAETVDEAAEGIEPEPAEKAAGPADHLLDGLSEALALVEAEDAARAAQQDRAEVRASAQNTLGAAMPSDSAGSVKGLAPAMGPDPAPDHMDGAGGGPVIAVVAQPHGIRVPDGPGLHSKRIARMAAGTYEPREIDGALAVVRPSDVVLDLGAGTGLVGAAVARAIAPRRVIARPRTATL